MKQNKQYIPYLLEDLLKRKEITLQDFFDLEIKPENLKSINNYNKIFRDVRTKIKDAFNGCKDINYYCKNDSLTETEEAVSNVETAISDIDYYVEDLDRINGQWESAYESLERLLIDIINRENIDISDYTSKISDAELKSFRRLKVIKGLLDK
jgi:hypothetical protein